MRANKTWNILKGLRIQNKDKSGISLKEWTFFYKTLLTEERGKFLETVDDSWTEDETKPIYHDHFQVKA